ncbi:MAG TPA: vitamin K epoxide reductase family protein [Thermoleophilaceae bacterium]|jgi:uncharacterized membrane protein
MSPGERRLVRAIAALALLGLAVAGYLTYVHYAGAEPFCVAGHGGCEKVQGSPYSELAGIPVALLGLGGYASLVGSLFLPGDAGRVLGALIAVVGFGFSAYLTYREVFTIEAICQWCVVSAVLMTVLAVLTVVRLARDPGGGVPGH